MAKQRGLCGKCRKGDLYFRNCFKDLEYGFNGRRERTEANTFSNLEKLGDLNKICTPQNIL